MNQLKTVVALACLLAPTFVESAMTVDALAWVDASHSVARVANISSRTLSFTVPITLLGVTAQLGPITSLRLQADIARRQGTIARELYVALRWPGWFDVAVGQLTPPLGYEAQTPLPELKLLDYSSVRRWLKPQTVQDVGVLLTHDRGWLTVTAACLNGNGTGQITDDNTWKDLCGRVVFRPGLLSGTGIAGRGYLGRTGDGGNTFGNLAGEAWLKRGRLSLAAEVQHAVIGPYLRDAAYLQCSYVLLPWFEPAGRFDIELQADDRYDLALALAGNITVPGERLKLVFGYRRSYWATNSIPGGVHSSSAGLRLQVVL